MDALHHVTFPGESEAYRLARNALLKAEMDLRRQIETVAEFRRKLPLGGKLKEDYLFEENATTDRGIKQTSFAELFATDKNSLIIYSFMYAPDDDSPCTGCNSLLNGLNGIAPPLREQTNFVVVAKSPVDKLTAWAKHQDWSGLRLLSSQHNSYNQDYHAETEEGYQIPAVNVFHKTDDGIFHFYNSELLYAPSEEGQHPRHTDLFWPLWNLLDLTPQGRSSNWFPKLEYR